MSAFDCICGDCCLPMKLKRKSVVVAHGGVLRHADEYECPTCLSHVIINPCDNPHRVREFDPEGYKDAYFEERAMNNLKVLRC